MNKNIIIRSATLAVGTTLVGVYIWTSDVQRTSDVVNSPEPSVTENHSVTSTPTKAPNVSKVPVPLPASNGRTSFVGEPVPWNLLLADASCELKGEIKFLNHNTYDNQDAVFIYKGIDHPARNIFWTITPNDSVSVGPNIFSNIPIPNGESLLGIILPDDPKYKRYELAAKIQYGRLVNGNVKVFEKQCDGKTVVMLP